METNLTRYAWLSIAAALSTMALKTLAWWLTGSVGLLSDAIESLVNLAGALMALWMLKLAATPADSGHPHGHSKAEYFSSAFEGLLIFLAALSIAYTAAQRLLHPQPLETVGVGLLVSALASIINFAVARILLRVGRAHNSITLEADAQHLMTDVWTSVGVMLGLALVLPTGWLWLDPAIALLVAGNILFTGWQLLRRSADGLLDAALPAEQQRQIEQVLDDFRPQGLDFHAIKTRQAGRHTFISLHVLVPGDWSVQRGHACCEQVEQVLRTQLSGAQVITHLEPLPETSSPSQS